jgi:hypothetical protein
VNVSGEMKNNVHARKMRLPILHVFNIPERAACECTHSFSIAQKAATQRGSDEP